MIATAGDLQASLTAAWQRENANAEAEGRVWVVQVAIVGGEEWYTLSKHAHTELPCLYDMAGALHAITQEKGRDTSGGRRCAYRVLHRTTGQHILVA